MRDMELYYYCAQALYAHFYHHLIPFQLHVAFEADNVALCPLYTMIFSHVRRVHTEVDTARCTIWAWDCLHNSAWLTCMYFDGFSIVRHPTPPLTADHKVCQHLKQMQLLKLGTFTHLDDFSLWSLLRLVKTVLLSTYSYSTD